MDGVFPSMRFSLCAPQGAGVAGFLRPATPGRPLTKFRSGDKTYRTDRVVKREGQAHAWPSFDLIFFKYSVSKGPKAPMAPCPSGGCGQSPRPLPGRRHSRPQILLRIRKGSRGAHIFGTRPKMQARFASIAPHGLGKSFSFEKLCHFLRRLLRRWTPFRVNFWFPKD